MTVCIDASVIIRCLTPEEGAEETLFWLYSKANDDIIAPAFLPVELGSALRRKMRSGEMTMEDCTEALAFYRKLEVRCVCDDAITESAFALAATLNQSTVYDTTYLAVAEKEDCDYWTLDQKFADAASSRYPRVRLLS